MEMKLTKGAVDFFNACDLAKSLTGKTPETGTQCWIYNMDEASRVNKKCEKCPYYNEFLKTEPLRLEEKGNYSLITLPAEIDEKRLPELRKLLDTALARSVKTLLLECSSLQQVSTLALGLILRTYKLLKEKSGELYILNPTEIFTSLLRSTMLSKILPTARSAEEVVALLQKKEDEIKSGEAKRKEEELAKRKKEAETLRCFEYWKGQNPANATPCSVCHFKVSGSTRPCWIVVGEIEGITFEYVNEDCLDCKYYIKVNPNADVHEIV
jgi:anti-anti-sigma factor